MKFEWEEKEGLYRWQIQNIWDYTPSSFDISDRKWSSEAYYFPLSATTAQLSIFISCFAWFYRN